ncbi:nucleotidyltransferase domain-containing protein [Sulfuricurvum sp.]|uniref:nucleotidyltransferase family protein n=1 Tax=Sulfuricurvum sp. TaxID=2025608 RepID=UPI002627E8A4|nr:nucleotidyltransferase domain-containing protein [Sulfuricurvum sp.]MDD4885016.1 nucleotidyltransferase domain-containing protein [Sulfuricurvum sp.]
MQKDQALGILKQFKDDFADRFGIIRIGLFGSTVRNEATSKSDIDVVVETKTPDMFAIVHAKNTLEELFHTNVDVIRYREKMNPYLKQNIEKEAVFV